MRSICSSPTRKGISSVQLSKDIGVTQKTAWFILGRIRHNLNDWEMPKFEGIVQIDETYVGGKNKGVSNLIAAEASNRKYP